MTDVMKAAADNSFSPEKLKVVVEFPSAFMRVILQFVFVFKLITNRVNFNSRNLKVRISTQ